MATKTITIPEISDCVFVIEAEPEMTPIRGNAVVTGNAEEDRKVEETIQRELDSGNAWAWCLVRVVCKAKSGLRGIEGSDCLGCCSYDSEEAFKAGGYFEDMKEEAYRDFVAKVMAL